MNVSELKNLFILHPGGTGGNHLANLISLIPEFEPRLDKFEGDYQQAFLKEYERFIDHLFLPIHPTQINNMKAHFLSKHGLNGLDKHSYNEEYAQTLLSNKKINILTGHWHCFDHTDLSEFKNHAWLILTFPKESSLAYKRVQVFNFWPQQIELYSEPYDFKHPVMNSKNTFVIDTDMFIADNGAEYLRQLLYECFAVYLPSIADEMHSKWMYGLKKTIELGVNKY